LFSKENDFQIKKTEKTMKSFLNGNAERKLRRCNVPVLRLCRPMLARTRVITRKIVKSNRTF